jgi:ribosome-associated protein
MSYEIPDAELRYRASRSRGPGGQHVNKSSTRVEVIWNVRTSPTLSDSEKARLLEKLGARIDSKGQLTVAADTYRSQLRNRDAARTRLQATVTRALRVPRPRKKTRPTKAAKESRLQQKRQQAEKKERRRPTRDDE